MPVFFLAVTVNLYYPSHHVQFSSFLSRFIELRLKILLDSKQITSEMSFSANLLASTAKITIKVGRKKYNNIE